MSNDFGNGITRITLTDGKQRPNKRAGISYDYMDKLNKYVKEGIFVDKDKNGFTKAEAKALGAEFEKLHAERGDSIDFKRMLAGKSFDYKNEEFIRLAKAAGYVLAEDVKTEETAPAKKVEETKPAAPKTEDKKPEEVKPEQKTPEAADEISSLAQELQEMEKGWSKDQLAHPQATLRNLKFKLQTEIEELQKTYTKETVTKHRFLRKAKNEVVKTPKTPEQIEADKLKAQEKMAEYDKIAKMEAVETLYSSIRPTKYAGMKGDKYLEYVTTTEDGRKLGAARVKKSVYDELYGCNVEKWVIEYYPLTLRNYNEGKENEYPQYYYRVAEDAKPVEGEVKIAEYKTAK